MSKLFRAIVIGSSIGIGGIALLGGIAFVQSSLAKDSVPATIAQGSIEKLFPHLPGFDMERLRKFDFDFGDGVSTVPYQGEVVVKYGFGDRSVVSIARTPSGTYSSDALVSPYVRYPGIKSHRHPDICGCMVFAAPVAAAPVEQAPPEVESVGPSSFTSVPAPARPRTITWL